MSNLARTIDAKKGEFLSYLEKAGAIDQLTGALVALYEEGDKAENAVQFIKEKLKSSNDEINYENLKKGFLDLKQENETLKKTIEQLTKELENYKNN